jgi:hypothetical protein
VLRRKTPDPRSLNESWSLLQGTREGRPLIARFIAGALDGAGHPDYPIQIGVAVSLKSPDTNGFPSADEGEQLNTVEDELVSLAGERARAAGPRMADLQRVPWRQEGELNPRASR